MDSFYDLFMTFVKCQSGVAVNGGTETPQISSKRFIRLPKMNKSLRGLEQHEGE